MENSVMKEAMALEERIIAHRRWLHRHAETGFDLPETVAYVKHTLEDMGYQVQNCGKSGLTTTIFGKKTGKVFLLRADMDALPIQEEAQIPYASKTGNMHACGHDLHTAMLLGAAQILKNHEKELAGTVKFMFQPAEEPLAGAEEMIKHGILENPKVDAGMMIHVATAVPIPTGSVIISAPGISAPAADYFTITVQGKGCHGSMPQEGIDPITCAAHILLGLQELHSRELGIADRAVMTIGTFQAGSAANVIADTAQMGGTIRTFDETLRAKLKTRIREITQGIATAYRCRANISFDSGAPVLTNDAAMCDFAERTLATLLGDKAIPLSKLPSTGPSAGGSEDFAYVSQRIPTVMLSLAAGTPNEGHTYPLHHPLVTFNEAALPTGAAVLAHMAMQYLEEHP